MSQIKEISQAWGYKDHIFSSKESAIEYMLKDQLLNIFNQRGLVLGTNYSPYYIIDKIIEYKEQIKLILANDS